MQITLFRDIVSSLAGSNAVKIVDLLYGKKNVNEFIIAKKLKLTINQTRNILYKLADEGLISFFRKKDRKKGGWYTYFWTLNIGKSLYKFKDKLSRDIGIIKQSIGTKKASQFFYCPNCSMEYNAEQALLNQYTCPECGEVLQVKDNSGEIAELEKQAVKLQKVLDEINSEILIIEEQEGKLKKRRSKAEAKKKGKERLARKKEKARLERKLGKGKKPENKKKKTKKAKTKKAKKKR